MSASKPRVVVAGQTPPPWGGQNVMVASALISLGAADDFDAVHLPFHFTRDWQDHRRVGLAKVMELVTVVLRLIRIRLGGPIDCLLFPFGGPHVAPLVRDMVLLPFCYAMSRRVVLHIHAGGLAEALPLLPIAVTRFVPAVYRRCSAAVVLTEFSRSDASSLGIEQIYVVPNSLPDEYDPGLAARSQNGPTRLLAVGHLGGPKGTPTLLQALAAVRERGYDATLTVIGEPLPPYSWSALTELIRALDLEDAVEVAGVVVGNDKWQRFASADLFVFPSTAPESQPLVLLEAMMWQLPLVASDWRGNAEILGDPPGGICYPPGDDHPASLTAALESALSDRAQLVVWGTGNRARFLDEFDDAASPLLAFMRRYADTTVAD